MATMDAAQVTMGSALVTGAIFTAPQGTTMPTNATDALDEAFKPLGFTSDAGLTITESRSTEAVTAWEGRTVVYNPVTEYTESISFTPIQCNEDVVKLTWGADNVTVTGGVIVAEHTGANMDPVAIVIETVPRPGIVRRYWGTFQLTERGDATLDGTQVDGRALTFAAIPDEGGVTMRESIAFTAGD